MEKIKSIFSALMAGVAAVLGLLLFFSNRRRQEAEAESVVAQAQAEQAKLDAQIEELQKAKGDVLVDAETKKQMKLTIEEMEEVLKRL